MTATEPGSESNGPSPEEAFALLGNETRMRILRVLGEADKPLSFSELRQRVDARDSGQFNYHLNELRGHFVRDTGEAYDLQRSGEHIIEAVLSGAVNESPRLRPTTIDSSCGLCSAPIMVSYQQEWVSVSCTECEGNYGEQRVDEDFRVPEQMQSGYFGGLILPPAGVVGRTPEQVVNAAGSWSALERMGTASGICPRCSASIETSVWVCETHEAREGLCESCHNRHAVQCEQSCTNCPYLAKGAAVLGLMHNSDLLAFLIAHELHPISQSPGVYGVLMEADEEVVSTDPIEVRFTWTIDDDALTLRIDDDLGVIEVQRDGATRSG